MIFRVNSSAGSTSRIRFVGCQPGRSKTAMAMKNLHVFESVAPLQAYSAGVEIFSQGDQARDVYCMEGGLIKLLRVEGDGRELIVDLRSSPWYLGSAAVIVQKPHPVTAITLTRCSLRRIREDVFITLLKTDFEFTWHFLQIC